MIVATEGLCKSYGPVRALDRIDLAVPAGSVFGLVGSNGAGKTTLLSIIAGLRRCTGGVVRLGCPADRVAVCPDTPEFEPWLTAREVLDFAATAAGTTADPQLLVEAGLGEVTDRRVGGFSRGMTQRLAVAATLVGEPQLVILDEPCAALDPTGRVEVLDLVARLGQQTSVLFSSHILADVQRVCDQVAVLHDRTLVYQGSVAQLLHEHTEPGWRLRVRPPVEPVLTALRRAGWVRRAEPAGAAISLAVTDLVAAERELPSLLGGVGASLVALEPAEAQLEDVYLRLTGR